MSLESCIRKAGKALTKEDATAIRALRDDIYGAGDVTRDQANEQAVSEYLDILQDERNFIMAQVEALGGALADPRLSPSKFAQQAAVNLEEAARKFPRKGVMRPPAEMASVDYKSGIRLEEGFYERNKKLPYFTKEILTERTEKTIESMWPDWYEMSPMQIVKIVNTFDPAAALGIAKKYNMIPQQSRSIETAQFRRSAQLESEKGVPKSLEVHDWGAKVIADWIKKNETLPLRYKVEEIFERDFVDSNPDHPLAVNSKYAQILDEAENKTKTPFRKLVDKIVSSGDMGREAVLAAVPQTKIPDFIKHGLAHPFDERGNEVNPLVAYTRTVKKMDAWMNRMIEGHHALAKTWLKFNRKFKDGAKLLGEFMHAATLSGVDVPSFQMPDAAALKKMNKQKRQMWADRKRDYDLLKPFWDKLGTMGEQTTYQQFVYNPETDNMEVVGPELPVSEGQKIYLAVRDTYQNMRTALIWNLEKRIRDTDADEASKAALIAQLRKQFEAGEINPYFPLGRFGKYAAAAYIKNDAGNWEPIAFIKRESRGERTDWVEAMRKKGFRTLSFDETASDLDMLNKIDPVFVANVTNLLKDTTVVSEDPKTGKEVAVPGSGIADSIWQMYLRTLPELSARKAYIHRIGRLGFNHDAIRTFSDHTFHGVHQMAKLRYAHELSKLLKGIEKSANLLMQRADHIKNWQDGHMPKGFEEATLHEVMLARIPEYASLYARMKRKAGVGGAAVHEPSHKQALKQILDEAERDGPWAVPVSEEVKRRHEYNMNPKSAPWSVKLTSLGFLWFLSTSPAAGVLNLTQTAISAYPILRARFNGSGAGMELLKASKEFAGQKWVGLHPSAVEGFINKLRGDESKAMEEFQQIGMFSKTRTRELMGLSEAGTEYSQRQEQILEIAGYIFHKTEEMNRAVTALAAYRLARKKLGNDPRAHEKAVLEAEELVEMSHYDYTNTNRPRFMQGDLGRVVFLFRNYSLNMQYRLIRDFRDGIWSNPALSKEERREARSRFLGMIGMTTIFAGVGGYPLFWAAEAIANNLLGDDDDPFDSKTQMRKLVFDATEKYIAEGWGQSVATAVMKGPWSAFTGADLSQRASLNNLWIREIPENLKDDPQGLMLHLAGEMLGPIFGIGMNFARGFSDIGAGHTDRALEKFMPKFMGDIGKTIRYATQGAQTYQRDIIIGPDEFTNMDKFLQFSGFTPTRLADRYEQNRAIKDMEQKLRNRRSDLLNRLFMAWRIGDRNEARQAMKDIGEWNKKQPRYPILPEGIIQSARTRAQYDMRTVAGAAVEKRLQYLHQDLQFTNEPGK